MASGNVTAQEVETAVTSFYRDGGGAVGAAGGGGQQGEVSTTYSDQTFSQDAQHNVKGQTHQWLTAAQMSSSAWSFAFELIQPGKKPEVQFFGASTLAVKVARFWHEVPDDQYQELRNRILQLMMAYRYSLPKLCVF